MGTANARSLKRSRRRHPGRRPPPFTSSGSETLTSSTEPPSETSDSTSETSSAETPSDGTTPQPTLDPETLQDRELTTADAFSMYGEWRDDRFDVAKQTQLKGLGVRVSSCIESSSENAQLEFRLANKFSDLTFSAGQSNTSTSSDMTLKVDVRGNGSQLEVQRIPFNKTHDFDISVADINALQITLYLDDSVEGCPDGGVEGVLYKMKLS